MSIINFTDQQNEILDCNSNNIIISACAGSGKSSTLTEKAFRESIQSKSWKKIQILTFTNKSKNDLIAKLNNSTNIIISTFHNFIYDNIFPFDEGIDINSSENYISRSNSYQGWLEELYSNKVICGSGGKNDFIIEHAIKLMEKNNLKNYLKSKFHAIYIDEAQDNNIQQYNIVELFISLGIKILMVGDANQTLYAFRGACSETFNKYLYDERFKRYELTQNFRCHEIINRIANSYSFPDQHVYDEDKGYFKINYENIGAILKKFSNESIAFLKKTNYELVDYGGNFSILKDISFSSHINETVKNVVISLLKLKYKKNYNLYSFLFDIKVDVDKYSHQDILSFRKELEVYIYKNNNTLDNFLIQIGFFEVKDVIQDTYCHLVELDETKNFIQNTNKHVTMTIHSSKGLEFDNIILQKNDLYHKGILQKNNFYVSLTRARKRVFVIF